MDNAKLLGDSPDPVGNDPHVWGKQWTSRKVYVERDYLDEGKITRRDQLSWKFQMEHFDTLFARAPGKEVLECGCGSAIMSVHAALQGFQATMLDFSPDGLDLAKANFDANHVQGKFVLGDVLKLPFPDNSFDVVMSYGLLEHFPDIDAPIREMVRVLKPSGIFAADIIPKRFSIATLGEIVTSWVRFGNRLKRLQFKNLFRESRRNFPHYENNYSIQKYRRALEEAGLKDIVVTGSGLFPQIGLPFGLEGKIYVPIIKSLRRLEKYFTRSSSRWTDWFGCSWYAHGIKA
ncbi:MAG: class I SAM-dependent methyltransferase [Elusimicrobia bacterium]|nr:class I SAM-dependent methyltransferase [Elusimicrobiota bacterium]